jgi:hypothetical protein
MDWKKISLHTTVYFTVITVIQLGSWMLANGASGGYSPLRVLCMLPFAALFALANVNYKYGEGSASLRVLLHFLLTVGGAFVFLYLPSRQTGDSVEAAVAIALILVVIYWIVMGIFLGMRARFAHIDRDTKQYESLYRPKADHIVKPAKDTESKKNKDAYQNVYKKN